MTAYAISRRNAIRCSLAAACALVLPTTLSACSKDAPHKAGVFIDGVIDDGGWGESCYRARSTPKRWQMSPPRTRT